MSSYGVVALPTRSSNPRSNGRRALGTSKDQIRNFDGVGERRRAIHNDYNYNGYNNHNIPTMTGPRASYSSGAGRGLNSSESPLSKLNSIGRRPPRPLGIEDLKNPAHRQHFLQELHMKLAADSKLGNIISTSDDGCLRVETLEDFVSNAEEMEARTPTTQGMAFMRLSSSINETRTAAKHKISVVSQAYEAKQDEAARSKLGFDFAVIHEDLLMTNATKIEAMLQTRLMHLPLGVRLWRVPGAGRKHNDGTPGSHVVYITYSARAFKKIKKGYIIVKPDKPTKTIKKIKKTPK